jgi:hypothetical protein
MELVITCVSGSISSSSSFCISGTAGGSKKLKKLSFFTVLVTVRTDPLLLCFCFFFTVFTVRFLPCFQLTVQPVEKSSTGQ